MTTNGKIVQVLGGVVDCEFPEDNLPRLFDAIEVVRPHEDPLVLEVEKHLGKSWVRCVAMDSTDGLARGMEVVNTGAPISVPVGPQTLGRIFNVLGRPVDQAGAVNAVAKRPIHAQAPKFEDQVTRVEVFETGIKVIDLIAPFTKGSRPLPRAARRASSAAPARVRP